MWSHNAFVPASKTETRVVSAPYDGVFHALCAAASAEAMTVTLADPAAGVIQISRGVSLATWGESLDVRLRPVPSGTEVTIHSALKFGLVDWGKNQQNIDTLFVRVGSALGGQVAGAWHPDPSGRHHLRWWDGVRWTDSVSDRGRPGTDPL